MLARLASHSCYFDMFFDWVVPFGFANIICARLAFVSFDGRSSLMIVKKKIMVMIMAMVFGESCL